VAVLGDVSELARGERKFSGAPSLIPPGTLTLQPEDDIDAPFYVRFVVKDHAGIVGDIIAFGASASIFPRSGSCATSTTSCAV
jgi:hypothetical protein